jgi:hypothetical protein
MTNIERDFIKALTDGTLAQTMADAAATTLKMSMVWREAIESAIKIMKLMIEKQKAILARRRVLEWEGIWLWD